MPEPLSNARHVSVVKCCHSAPLWSISTLTLIAPRLSAGRDFRKPPREANYLTGDASTSVASKEQLAKFNNTVSLVWSTQWKMWWARSCASDKLQYVSICIHIVGFWIWGTICMITSRYNNHLHERHALSVRGDCYVWLVSCCWSRVHHRSNRASHIILWIFKFQSAMCFSETDNVHGVQLIYFSHDLPRCCSLQECGSLVRC